MGEIIDQKFLSEHLLFTILFHVSYVVFGDSFGQIFTDFGGIGTNLRYESGFPLLFIGF